MIWPDFVQCLAVIISPAECWHTLHVTIVFYPFLIPPSLPLPPFFLSPPPLPPLPPPSSPSLPLLPPSLLPSLSLPPKVHLLPDRHTRIVFAAQHDTDLCMCARNTCSFCVCVHANVRGWREGWISSVQYLCIHYFYRFCKYLQHCK